MRQALVSVESVEALGPFARIRLAAPDLAAALEPGRALLAHSTRSYLRRTWWPCEIGSAGFAVLLNDEQAAEYRAGDRVDVLGPVGRGFHIDSAARNLLLVAAGSSAPVPALGPLLPLVDRALASGRAVTLAYAAPDADRAYPLSALSSDIEVIRAADANLIGLLPDAIGWSDQVFACGAADLADGLVERIRSTRFPVPRNFLQALQPVALPCGTGACGACWNGSKLACVDGPVFERLIRSAKAR